MWLFEDPRGPWSAGRLPIVTVKVKVQTATCTDLKYTLNEP